MDFVPLSRVSWPRKRTVSRKYSPFKSTYDNTINLLIAELEKVRASRVTIYADLAQRDIRLDGLPRSDSRAVDPGVMLTFEVKGEPVQFACDTYCDWKSNLRAIALTLEHLRTVERYGATQPGQQYQGYRPELPASPTTPGPGSVAAAVTLIRDMARRGGWDPGTNDLKTNPAALKRAYRAAMLAAHPDAGGTEEDAKRVNAAMELLKAQQ